MIFVANSAVFNSSSILFLNLQHIFHMTQDLLWTQTSTPSSHLSHKIFLPSPPVSYHLPLFPLVSHNILPLSNSFTPSSPLSSTLTYLLPISTSLTYSSSPLQQPDTNFHCSSTDSPGWTIRRQLCGEEGTEGRAEVSGYWKPPAWDNLAETGEQTSITIRRLRGCPLKGNKGQNQYFTCVYIGNIQVTFIKGILYPDKVNFEISPLKVGIGSLCWDHDGRNPNKRS